MKTRSGSTLTEVMISVLVIGIGGIAVLSLFPLAVSRSLRANQLTQATIHRYNAEEQLETLRLNTYWPFVVEPTLFNVNVGDTPWTNANHYPGNVGDDNGNYYPDHELTWLPGPDGLFGQPGGDTTPGFSDTNYVSDDIPVLDEFEVRFAGRDSSFIVIDPFGWWEVGDLGTTDPQKLSFRNHFGNHGPAATSSIPRLNGGFRGNNSYSTTNPRVRPTFIGFYESPPDSGTFVNFDIPPAITSAADPDNGNLDFGGWGFNRHLAEQIVMLPDQYSTLIDVIYLDTANIDTIPDREELLLPGTLSDDVLADVITNIQAGLEVRATFFGVQGTTSFGTKKIAYSRSLLHEDINNNGILDPGEDVDGLGTLDVMSPPPAPAVSASAPRLMKWSRRNLLPPNFQIERVTVQARLADFTWMVSARLPTRPPTQPQIDVIVFHKRQTELIDEQPYVATQVGGVKKVYSINYGASSQPRPWVKKGSYMLDMEHGYWMLITDVSESGTTITVTLERDVRDSPSGPTDDVTSIIACFPRGIVDVFPLGAK